MGLGEAVCAAELLLDAGARHVLVEPGRLDHEIRRRGVAHQLVAVGEPLARDVGPDELGIEEIAAFLQVHPIGHLADEVRGADHPAEHALVRPGHLDLVEVHLVAGEMHQPRRERGLGAEADLRQVRGDELGAAADVHLGEHGAVGDVALARAPQVAGVVKQRDQHAEHRAARAEALARRAHALVAVDQPRHGERHVERVAHIVVKGVAGEVTGKAALEQRLEIVEGARQGGEIAPWIARGEERDDRVAHALRLLHVDAIRDVVPVEPVVHGSPARLSRRRRAWQSGDAR